MDEGDERWWIGEGGLHLQRDRIAQQPSRQLGREGEGEIRREGGREGRREREFIA